MRRALVLVLLAGLVVSTEKAALGCSCAMGDPRTRLSEADAAFVGSLVHKESPTPGPGGVYGGNQQVTYTFDVEQSVKGDLGDRVDVESATDGAACGIETPVGQRIGLLLRREGDLWKSSLCSQMDPEALIDAAKPLPAPNGSGPVRFLVGGRFGGVRLVALDRRGKTLAYGKGKGYVSQISVCPNAQRVLEISYETDGNGTFTPTLTVRDVASLKVLSQRALKSLEFTSPDALDVGAIRCLTADGSQLYVFVTEYGEPHSSGAILKFVDGKKAAAVYEGDADSVIFADTRTAYITAGKFGADVARVELPSGRARVVARNTGGLTRSLSVSPDGTRLAGMANNWALEPDEAKLVLIDMRESPARVRKVVIGSRDLAGPTLWYGNDRIVVTPGDETVRVYDASLKQRSSLKGWHGNTIAISGDTLYGCGWGWVGAAALPAGPVRKLHAFDSPELFAFAVVPAAAPVAPKAAPKPTPTETDHPPPAPTPTVQAVPAARPRPPEPPRGPAASGAAAMALIVGTSWLLLVRRRGLKTRPS